MSFHHIVAGSKLQAASSKLQAASDKLQACDTLSNVFYVWMLVVCFCYYLLGIDAEFVSMHVVVTMGW
jgi:hypothetical protein